MIAAASPAATEVASVDAALALYAQADVPVSAHINLTYRCDLDCQHCYLDNRTTYPEMTGAEWRAVLDQLAAMGTLLLTWSGGDVSQRADFEELLAYATAKGFANRIKTHAGNVDAAVAARYAEQMVTRVDVSVYSLRPEIHDAFTRHPGSLARTLTGIQCLRAVGVPVQASVVVQDQTVEEIPAIFDRFVALGCTVRFGLDISRDNAGNEGLDSLNLAVDRRIRAEQLIALTRTVPPPTAQVKDRLSQGPCGAGRRLVYIAPDGGVWPCVVFPMELGNLRQQALADIWSGSPARLALRDWTNRERTACHSCGGSGACFYCPGEAFKNTGDYRKPPGHFHTRTRLRMLGYEAAHGPTWAPEQWASVPAGSERPPRPERFVFPIYRPRKGQGARVLAAPSKP